MGKINTGYAVVSEIVRENKKKYKILENGLLDNTLDASMDNMVERLHDFTDEVYHLGKNGAAVADRMIIERFIPRPGPAIATGEVVNMAIGHIMQLGRQMHIDLVAPVTWKNAYRKNVEHTPLKEAYLACRTTPHQLDAALLALYAFDKTFPQLRTKREMGRFMAQMEATSKAKLINRRMA